MLAHPTRLPPKSYFTPPPHQSLMIKKTFQRKIVISPISGTMLTSLMHRNPNHKIKQKQSYTRNIPHPLPFTHSIRIPKNLLWTLHHILLKCLESSILHLLRRLAISARYQMRCDRCDGCEGHIRTVRGEWDAGFWRRKPEFVVAPVQDGGLDAGGLEGFGEAAQGQGGVG
jgi:hypothetical protein